MLTTAKVKEHHSCLERMLELCHNIEVLELCSEALRSDVPFRANCSYGFPRLLVLDRCFEIALSSELKGD